MRRKMSITILTPLVTVKLVNEFLHGKFVVNLNLRSHHHQYGLQYRVNYLSRQED